MWATSNKYLLRFSVQLSSIRYVSKVNNAISNEIVSENQRSSFTDSPISNEQTKLIKVSLLGMPNAGKSTIVNSLAKRAVCATSQKIHTTAKNAQAILTKDNTQIVFIDTPGVLTPYCIKKYKKPQNNNIILHALRSADLIGITLDVTNKFNRSMIQPSMKALLQNLSKSVPFILIFNKIDKIKQKEMLLSYTKTLTTNPKLPPFEEVFMISALNGDGIDDLRDYLISIAKPRPWMYNETEFTDQRIETIVEETLRAKLLDSLPAEIPYSLKIRIVDFEHLTDGSMKAIVEIICSQKRLIHQIIKGGKLRTACRLAQDSLRNAFRNSVLIRASVLSSEK